MTEKIIIFDMDGVLIDSEPAYLEMNKKLFREFGIEMTAENYKALVGMASIPMWTMLKEKYNLKNELSEFMDMEKRRMYEILDSEIISAPIEGILNLLNKLKDKNYILSVASSSGKENINFVLKKLKLISYFDFIVSGEEVSNGKPSPDIFLKVRDKFNARSGNCYVIEDSANGILAAIAAGMNCIGFSNDNNNKQDLTQADIVINNFSDDSIEEILFFIN